MTPPICWCGHPAETHTPGGPCTALVGGRETTAGGHVSVGSQLCPCVQFDPKAGEPS